MRRNRTAIMKGGSLDIFNNIGKEFGGRVGGSVVKPV
jgi:hypothetical protein